jgi:putative inorganic carbon (HCO3(-)) transporter
MIRLCNQIIEYSFYLLFALVPLILTPWNYELFEFNKMMLTYLLTVVIVGTWLIKMVASKRVIFRRTPLDIPILLFFVSQLLSFLVSIDRHTSLFGYYSRFNGGLFSIISYILLYYAFVSNMTKEKALAVGRWLLVGAALVAIYGIAEHFGIDAQYWVQDVRNRVFSTLGQPNWLAAYLVALSPLTWGFALLNDKLQMTNYKLKFKIKNSILYSLFSILYLCLLYTKSRSGLLGFAVAYLVFWSLAFFKEKKKIIKKFIIFTLFSLLFALLVGTPWTPHLGQAFQRLSSGQTTQASPQPEKITVPQIGDITPSGEIRKIVWAGASDIWRHHPFLGTGPETFAYSYYWYRPREHNDTSEWDFLYNKAHNEYLNYLATTGIFGLGSYLLIIGTFIWWSLKLIFNAQCSMLNLALLAGYAGLLVCRFFGFSVVITNIFFFLFPTMSFVLTTRDQGGGIKTPRRCRHVLWVIGRWSLVVVILFAICYLLFAICKLWYADFLFSKGKNSLKSDAPVQAYNYLQDSTRLNQSEPLFHNELSTAASLLAIGLSSENATAAAQMASFAIQESDKAVAISPYHLNYLKTRTKMFYNLGQIDADYYVSALETLLLAKELAPTDAKVTYNLGLLYYYLGQKNEAVRELEKTLELKPNHAAAIQKLEEWQKEK